VIHLAQSALCAAFLIVLCLDWRPHTFEPSTLAIFAGATLLSHVAEYAATEF